MNVRGWALGVSSILLGSALGFTPALLTHRAVGQEPPALVGPLTDTAPETEQGKNQDELVEVEAANPLHDALRPLKDADGGEGAGIERAPKEPPPPVTERASTERPDPQARWFNGYWSWDPTRNDFVWVSGTWKVPPMGSIWIEGRWRRDDKGWYRVPGLWSQATATSAEGVAEPSAAVPPGSEPPLDLNPSPDASAPMPKLGWRENGPPRERPDDDPGQAPGADYFYIPGEYYPEGDRAVWRKGFWAQAQPGWEWVPARWVRQASGWQFREGYWGREPGASSPVRNNATHTAARPSDLPSGRIIESEPADRSAAIREGEGNPNGENDRDVISDAERGRTDPTPADPRVYPPAVVPPNGAPLYGPSVGYDPYYDYRYYGPRARMIRPPSPLYGPSGVVVPGAVPPFVQRILDRVLPY